MKAVMVMFDSLNRRMLPNYGCTWTKAENFARLGEKAAVFDNCYVGSLPCMPARRELHTGRYGFLHRSWGPLEPFDNSMPEILKNRGVYTHLVSDHYHYWEDGGATYHSRYSSWDAIRGQEGDTWDGYAGEVDVPEHVPTMREFTHPEWWEHNWKNRERIRREDAWPQDRTFDAGLAFLEANKGVDNWFLQIETFDPHEPFDSPDAFRALYQDDYDGPHFDWPPYAPVSEGEEIVEHTRKRYAALLSMCDRNLGRVIDFFDQNDLWKDTLLIVNTDHGFMLGEKDWWAKSVMPCYNELANTPFFVWDPRSAKSGVRRQSLVQTIDIAPTLLDFFGAPIPPEMQGKPLRETVESDKPIREAGLFGFHGSFVNVTDGRHVFMKASESLSNTPLYEYTLMPTHQQGFFTPDELKKIEITGPLLFTRGCQLMKLETANRLANATFCNSFQYGDLLWDLEQDPEQTTPSQDEAAREKMMAHLLRLLKESDAGEEQYQRLGLSGQTTKKPVFEDFAPASEFSWTQDAKNIFMGMLALLPEGKVDAFMEALRQTVGEGNSEKVERKHFMTLAKQFYSPSEDKCRYFVDKLSRLR